MPLNIPNFLTLLRLIAAPAIALVFLILDRPAADILAFLIFTLASITDFVDGYLARKWGQVTQFGRVLDPIADKAMVIIGLAVLFSVFGFTYLLVIPAVVIFFREVFVSGLRESLGDRAVGLKVTGLAKWKTTVQMVAIGALLLGGATLDRVAVLDWIGFASLWIAAALTFVTGVDYAMKATALMKEEGSP